MYGKEIDDIIELFEDIKMSSVLCDDDGKILWCSAYARDGEMPLCEGATLASIFMKNEVQYGKAKKVIAEQGMSKGELICFSMDFEFKVKGIKEKNKIYSFWIFEKKLLSRKSRKNKISAKHMSNIANNYSNLIFEIYNTTEPIARAFERVALFEELTYVNLVSRNCYSLLRMTTNIDEYMRAVSGKNLSYPTLCSLKTELQEFITQLNLLLQAAELTVEISFDNEDKKYFVNADIYKLYLAILNVLNNSFRHSFSSVPISIYVSDDDEYAVIEITDEGDGMNEQMVEHAFDAFYSTNLITNTPEGLGLGLFVTKSIIEELGGNVSISSKEYEQTTVTLRLPLAEVSQSAMYLGSGKVMYDMLEEPLSIVHSFLPSVCTVQD